MCHSGAEDRPADGIPGHLILKHEITHLSRQPVTLPIALGPAGIKIVSRATARGLDRIGCCTEVVLGDVSDAGRLPCRIRSEPRRPAQRPGRTHRMTAEGTSVHHPRLTGGPSPSGSNGVAGTLIIGTDGLEDRQDVFCAVGRPQREKAVVSIGQRTASAKGDHPRISDFGKDHSLLPRVRRGNVRSVRRGGADSGSPGAGGRSGGVDAACRPGVKQWVDLRG